MQKGFLGRLVCVVAFLNFFSVQNGLEQVPMTPTASFEPRP